MSTTQVIDLLKQAIALLEGGTPTQPTATPSPSSTEPDEEVLEGVIGRPEFKSVGEKLIPLYTAGLNVDGAWFNLNAWRKTAVWARDNTGPGSRVRATGKWDTQEWTGQDGMPRTKTVFIVRSMDLV